MDNKKIGKLISSLRRQQGLTQQDLGDKVGVGFRAVSKWERGITLPDISIINELSKILGISSDELLAGELNKPTKKKDKKKIPINIKITISIVTLIIIVITSVFIYQNNKTYVYNIVSANEDEYIVEGQVTYKNKELSIIINKLYFKDKKFTSTIIKNYEYDIKSGNKYIFGYGKSPNGKNTDKMTPLKNLLEQFEINYKGKTELKRKELLKNNININFRLISENNENINIEVKIKLYHKNHT